MKFFDSLVHVVRDGTWLGGCRFDASLRRLLAEQEHVECVGACLVAIADYQDNDYVLEVARIRPGWFVPIGGLNPGAFPDTSSVGKAVRQLSAQGFVGVKLHPRLNRYDPLDPRCLAAIDAAGSNGLVVFLDTLFRQRGIITKYAPDIVDHIANTCAGTRLLLLHAGGSSMLDLFEMARMHKHVWLDLSFVLLRYAGSSLDCDIRFLCENFNQRLTVGSDFPEYTPAETLHQLTRICRGLPQDKIENVLWKNLGAFLRNDDRVPRLPTT